MASSKLKMPPASHQKRATPDSVGSTTFDQNLFTAFKKLRVDINGSCVKKTEDHSKEPLKHKPDASGSEHQGGEAQQATDNEEWSQNLQKFCFCDEGAINKNGRARLKSMCRFHRLLARKGNSTGNSKNSLNFARAVRDHKPLLQEGRLKLAENKSENLPLFMRCARFEFSYKPVKFGDAKKNSELDTASVKTTADVLNTKASANIAVAGTPLSPAHDESSSKETTIQSQPMFAASISEHLSSFSSLHPGSDNSTPTPNTEDAGPTYEGYRNVRHRRHLALWPQTRGSNSNTSSVPYAEDSGAAAAAVPPRVDLAVERSCSQEARLDEGEFSVNELAAYFDNFLYMPKEMSSMAQMMYT